MTVNSRKKILNKRPKNQNIKNLNRNISRKTAEKVRKILNINEEYTFINQFSNNYFISPLCEDYIKDSILYDDHVFLSTVNVWNSTNKSNIQFIAAIATIDNEGWVNGNRNYHIKLIMSDLNIKASGMPILNMLKEIYDLYIKNTNNIMSLECLKHNISFYTSLGFKYNEVRTINSSLPYMIYDTDSINAIQMPVIQKPTLKRNISLTNSKKNIKSYQIPEDLKIEIYRVGLGEHIGRVIINNGQKVANSVFSPM